MEEPVWVANLLYVILLAIVLVPAFYVVFVRWELFALTATGWKFTDYFTVTLTSLSIVGAVAAARQHQLTLIDHTLGSRISSQTMFISSSLNSFVNYFCMRLPQRQL